MHYLDIQPFSLEEKIPIPLVSNNPEATQTENTAPEPLTVSETIPTGNPIELESTEETAAKTQEVSFSKNLFQ